MEIFQQPMLAVEYNPNTLEFPLWASPKFDGYRCNVFGGEALTRTGKKFRNDHVQSVIGKAHFNGLDGELVVGLPYAPDVFNKSSAVMKKDGNPDFTFIVFDDFSNPELNYETRLCRAANKVNLPGTLSETEWLSIPTFMCKQTFINNMEELDAFEAEQIELGYEGIMVRKPGSPYKHGRSTLKQGYLLKVKRFSMDEATIIGYEELMHNGNEAVLNEIGKTKRSDSKDGLYPSGMIGSYIVTSPKYAEPFKISCGAMTHDQRRKALIQFASDDGKIARFKYFAHGTKDAPRHGIFDAFRDRDDILPPESD